MSGNPENNLKKSFTLVLLLASALLLFIPACSGESPTPEAKLDNIRLVGTIGPLSLPLAYMVDHNSLTSIAVKTTLTTWANPGQLQAMVSGGQADFVSLPTNSAATFYNR